MSDQQGRKKSTRTKKTMPLSNVLTTPGEVPLGHAVMPQDHRTNIPYPFSMHPHPPYYLPHQPYSYDNAMYPFTYHLHGDPGTMVDPRNCDNGYYPGFEPLPPSRGDNIKASIKCVSGADDQSQSTSENSAESSDCNAPPSTEGERNSIIPHGGPHGVWFAGSNPMYPGATHPHPYANYHGYLNTFYHATSFSHRYNLQPVESSTSGAVSNHAASRASGAAFDNIKPLGSAKESIDGTVSESRESNKHYSDSLEPTEPAALSGAALQSTNYPIYKTGRASAGRMARSVPSASSARGIQRENSAALSGADIRPPFKTGDGSTKRADKTDTISSVYESQTESAAALSGAAVPPPTSSLRSRKGFLTVTTSFPTEPTGIYRPNSYSPSRGSHARLGLSFTTSSEQTSGWTTSFSTSHTDSEEGPDDITADIPSLSEMFLNTDQMSQPPSGCRMSVPTDKRTRKNELARQRSLKIKEQIEEILQKPETQISSEEARIFHHYEAKRLMKNERSRNLAKGKKLKIMTIRSKPLNERTREEQVYLERAMKAKFRKNEGDRLRRLRAKELSFASGDSSSKLNLEDSFSEDAGVQVIPMEDRLSEYHDEPLSPDFRNAISFFSTQSPYTAQSLNASHGILPPSLPDSLNSPDPALFYAISPIRNPAFDADYQTDRSNQGDDGINRKY